MKILFINLKDIEGGAAKAAYRLSKGLETWHQTENYFIVKHKASRDKNVFATISNKGETLTQVMVFFEYLADRLFSKLGFQYYFLPFSPSSILKKAREIQPDIISLHITHGGYFKTSLLKNLSKVAPIVWTQHDMWAFTANAAHTFGDESWKQLKAGSGEKYIYPHIGVNRGRALLKRKKRIYKKSHLHLVTPSGWLNKLVKQSPVFKDISLQKILHGIDLEVFKPNDPSVCRKALGINENAKIIMFSSCDDLENSPWKGGQLLMDILSGLNSKTDCPIEVLILGKGKLSSQKMFHQLNFHYFGYVQSEELISLLLSAADLFIYPTQADSLGLVLVESIACGTPCITFDIGGCGDVIKDNISGFKIKPFDINSFIDKTLELLTDKEKLRYLAEKSRKLAEEHFSIKEMANAYYQLFKKIIKTNR